jgi:hypothetical protein
VIITSICGGLGNQLFEYSFSLYLKKNLPYLNHYLDISWFDFNKMHSGFLLEDVFNINAEYVKKSDIENFKKDTFLKRLRNRVKLTKFQLVPEKRFSSVEQIKTNKNYLFSGYWQNSDYVEAVKDTLNKKLRFNLVFNPNEEKQIEMIQKSFSVSLHLRRGDYLSPENKAKFIGSCTNEYYQAAMKYFLIKYPEILFFVFSDDTEYAINMFKKSKNVKIMEKHEKDSFDLFYMSLCKHNIIANSSFSWWAAWLNKNPNKEIICPSKWFNYDDISSNIQKENWIKIDRNGEFV